MNRFTFTACVLLFVSSISGFAEDQRIPERFTPLFNGTDFEGWEGNLEFFRIEERAVVAGRLTEPIPRNEFLCTKESSATLN